MRMIDRPNHPAAVKAVRRSNETPGASGIDNDLASNSLATPAEADLAGAVADSVMTETTTTATMTARVSAPAVAVCLVVLACPNRIVSHLSYFT
ncbi:MAG: hypothetical protein BWY92_00344 [Firmicutes bacterium ADurb.BinA052]|nr:MAG: hypothetical protein BWY92_00344 [Firmicutes bacterium ADurb.BinA052]